MTQEEGMFLSQMMHMETLLPRQKVLCEMAANLYGQKYKELVAKTQDGACVLLCLNKVFYSILSDSS